MKRYILEDVGMAMDTMFYEAGTIKSYPANYERNQHILAGTAKEVKVRGWMTIFDDGEHTFVPSATTNIPRYHTVYKIKNGTVRETKENLIVTIKLPKRMGKHKLCAKHYETFISLHKFLKKFKW